jgi:predicted acetyltransferase
MDHSTYTLSTLAEHPDYYDDVIKLIEEEFQYSELFSFAVDFAPLVNPNNFENCIIIIHLDSQKVVAHLGVLPRTMIKNNILLPVLMIGGIVTHKSHRGKQLFRTLMNHVCELYQNKIALAFLWSELTDLYEKFSFTRAGGIIETGKGVITNDKIPNGFIKTNFSKLSPKELNEIKNIYFNFNQQYFFTLTRDAQDWSIIQNMSSIDLYIKKSPAEDKIESYFCYGKGKDLTCIIHELGTEKDNYNELINSLSSFKTWLPETEKIFFINKQILFSSFIKILNRKILHDFLYSYTQTDLAILSFHQQTDIELSYQGDTFQLTEKDFIEGLFGPNPLEEFEALGLSPYIAGTDSI